MRRVCLTRFISPQTSCRGAAGCGRGGGRAGVNDRALFGAGALVRTGPSHTIAGVTGPQGPRVRGLMSQYWAKRSRPVWSATAGSDGFDRAKVNCLFCSWQEAAEPPCHSLTCISKHLAHFLSSVEGVKAGIRGLLESERVLIRKGYEKNPPELYLYQFIF